MSVSTCPSPFTPFQLWRRAWGTSVGPSVDRMLGTGLMALSGIAATLLAPPLRSSGGPVVLSILTLLGSLWLGLMFWRSMAKANRQILDPLFPSVCCVFLMLPSLGLVGPALLGTALCRLARDGLAVISEWYLGAESDWGKLSTLQKPARSHWGASVGQAVVRALRAPADLLRGAGAPTLGSWGVSGVRSLPSALGSLATRLRTFCIPAGFRQRTTKMVQAVAATRLGLAWRINRLARRLDVADDPVVYSHLDLHLSGYPATALTAWHHLLQEMAALDAPERRALSPLVADTLRTLLRASRGGGGLPRDRMRFLKAQEGVRADILANPAHLDRLLEIARRHTKTFRVIDAWVHAALTVPESAAVGFRLPLSVELLQIQKDLQARAALSPKEDQVAELLATWRSEFPDDARADVLVAPDTSVGSRTNKKPTVPEEALSAAQSPSVVSIRLVPEPYSFVFGPFPAERVHLGAPWRTQDHQDVLLIGGAGAQASSVTVLSSEPARGSSCKKDAAGQPRDFTRSDPAGGAVNAPILRWHAQAPDRSSDHS